MSRCRSCNKILQEVDLSLDISNDIHMNYFGIKLNDSDLYKLGKLTKSSFHEEDLCYSCKTKLCATSCAGYREYAHEDLTNKCEVN